MYIYVCLYNARVSVFGGPARSRVVLNFLLLEREIEDPSNAVCYTGAMGLTSWCLAGSQQAVLEPLGTGKAGDIRLSVPALVAGLRGCSRWVHGSVTPRPANHGPAKGEGFWNRNRGLWGSTCCTDCAGGVPRLPGYSPPGLAAFEPSGISRVPF